MERLSRDVAEIPHECEIVVIGTGYGGSIIASRLARAGRDVVVLERGRELHPGQYPNTLTSASDEMQVEVGADHTGSRSALFSLRVGEMNVFHGIGLGGTSLINANVSLRPDDAVLDDARWPRALRADRVGLDEGYRRAREMLRPEPYPDDFPHLAKLDALRATAGTHRFERTPINVTFRAGPNVVGVDQAACTGCGDCVTGCNVGAKNTLLMNYLPDAVGHGARVFTETEVRAVERAGDTWLVHYQLLDVGRERFDAPELTVTADIVVVAAGVLGTAEILGRSQARGLVLSDHLGEHFSGNGDVLGFAYDTTMTVNGIGCGDRTPSATSPPGPCITGVVFQSDRPGATGPIIIEDGVIPGALAPLLPVAFAAAAATSHPTAGGLRAIWRRIVDTLASLLRGWHHGADKDSLTFLVMGDDDGTGRVTFSNDHVAVVWPGVGTSSYYEAANNRLVEAAAAIGGEMVPSPTWHELLDDALVTVHPLGGCVMADDASLGVVDDRGRAFCAASGTATYANLYVCDGSVIPRPLGVNPLLTISAIAERTAALLAAEHHWRIDYSSDPVRLPEAEPTTPGVEFSESMTGFFSAFPDGTYETAAAQGRSPNSTMQFVLLITSDDVDQIIHDPGHPATATGTVVAPALSASPITVTEGVFRLFVTDPDLPETRNMKYELPLVTAEGRVMFFEGLKFVHPSFVTQAWAQTTTLYVTVYEGTDTTGAVVGRGILTIPVRLFAKQMLSMTATNAPTEKVKLRTLAHFGEYFAGVMWDDYGGIFRGPSRLDPTAPPRARRPLTCGVPEVFPVETSDQVALKLSRYEGGSRGPVVLVHGMGASSRLYSTDTVAQNLTEYLWSNGFDVWLFDWRGSPLLPVSDTSFNGDQVAARDFPAAQAIVRATTGHDDVHWVVHCVGSITFFMSALSGAVTPTSIAALQVATDTIAPWLTNVKVDLHLASLLEMVGVTTMTTDAYSNESWIQRRVDDLLELYPIPSGERCTSAVCHRISFLYGLCWQHEQMSDETHSAVHEMFGIANLEMMRHMARCSARQHVVGADGADIYLPHLERLNVPVTLFSGARSHVWNPESTEATMQRLTRQFGPDQVRRVLFDERGHLDPVIGRTANLDVYPALLAHLNRVGA